MASLIGDGKITHTLGLCGGDGAEFSVDEIIGFVQPAAFGFAKVCDEGMSIYIKILAEHGLTRTDEGIQLKIFEVAKSQKA